MYPCILNLETTSASWSKGSLLHDTTLVSDEAFVVGQSMAFAPRVFPHDATDSRWLTVETMLLNPENRWLNPSDDFPYLIPRGTSSHPNA